MQAIQPHLPDIWLFLIAFFLLYYAVTDGSDLGVGIISLFASDETERGMLMAAIEKTWHANQTWLVILGGMMFGAFPLFYGVVLSTLYIPIVLMLFGFGMRGAAFEFRAHSESKRKWGLVFGFGSLFAALAQGFALGGLLGGLDIKGGAFSGNVWAWATPFTAFVTIGVICGYVMLGSNYLIMKTLGKMQDRSYRRAWISSCLTLFIAVATYAWCLEKYPFMSEKWEAFPDDELIAVFPALAVCAFLMLFRSLRKRHEAAPIFWNAAIIIFSFAGLSIGMHPYMIPHVISEAVTTNAAAASPMTLSFMLVVALILIPILLLYTSYEYWVFRGKTMKDDHGYEE